ncbi:MAG: TfoX/Sxy family protein [Patescibacteria group bacterium]|uniref:TfoX/Sxy family protein n=1 Tax=candidate division WWE3 bacterium TaxID=2053526 RepID=A0A955J2Y2_UNCKA|nr:TfoX/Sxy family protein [candidate division WWE3 bacterium]
MTTKEFKNHILSTYFVEVPNITTRAMFGGYALYKDGIIFSLLTSDNKLYFKVDAYSAKEYAELGGEPFVYQHFGKKPAQMPYYTVPQSILENPKDLLSWIDTALEVSRNYKSK